MNQPEQPIEALLDEVDAYCNGQIDAYPYDALPRLSRELRQRISEIDEAMKVMGHKSPETLIGAARNTTYARDIEKQNAEAAMVKLRQRIEREQRLMRCPECNWQTSELTASAREESPCPNCGKRTLGQFIQQPATTKPRQQLEQQQQSEEMK